MRPIELLGHSKPVTQVVYNREGDLLFSSAKDFSCLVTYTNNGDLLGSYDGHMGAVSSVTVDYETQNVGTCGWDNQLFIFDCETGAKKMKVEDLRLLFRKCQFSYSGNLFAAFGWERQTESSHILLYDVRQASSGDSEQTKPCFTHTLQGVRGQTMCWSYLDQILAIGDADGQVGLLDIKSSKSPKFEKIHDGSISDIQLSPDETMIVTASDDCSAKVLSSYDLEEKKRYSSDRPVNSATISPIRPHVLLGGGQAAKLVTQASGEHFETKFYHLVFENMFAIVKDHFGPIRTLAFHPSGNGYASGAEDGYIKLHTFDNDYNMFDDDMKATSE